MRFEIDNMTCGACARSVTRAIHALDAEAKVEIDIPTKRVEVETIASPSAIEAALGAVGFESRLAD